MCRDDGDKSRYSVLFMIIWFGFSRHILLIHYLYGTKNDRDKQFLFLHSITRDPELSKLAHTWQKIIEIKCHGKHCFVENIEHKRRDELFPQYTRIVLPCWINWCRVAIARENIANRKKETPEIMGCDVRGIVQRDDFPMLKYNTC